MDGKTVLNLSSNLPDGEPFQFGDHLVINASSCAAADLALLEQGGSVDGVVVDPLVPQSGWDEDKVYRYPGLEWAARVGGDTKIAVLGILPGDDVDTIAGKAEAAGAVGVFDMFKVPLKSVVQEMFAERS